ncbi:MAG: putative DNA binding domain-containing protein [Erysipelotrichaceae bacterium]|nr:putative DNA binding domain-containing protein [Erysipelotrichaceae bacterium]
MINIGKENEYTEFKKSTSELNEAVESISAMLNKHGKGKVYFGVKNNGDCIGQQISDNTLRDISRKIYEDIKPTIYPSIHEMENIPGVIEVEFIGNDKPYSAQGRFYIRVFDEDKKIDINELLKMVNRTDSSNSVWEKMESEDSVDDADEDLLKDYIRKANECGRITDDYSNKKEVLGKLGLITGNHLNNAGRILFSKNKPITLKLAVFATDEKLSFIDINRFEGNLFECSKKGQEYIKQHINYSAEIVGSERKEVPEIPSEAIREVVLNSLCHSSFDTSMNNEIYITPTKICVFNPGTFPSGYEPKDFAYNGVESILRNPLISKVLYYANEIDSWATGFRRVFTYCEKDDIKLAYTKKDQGFEFVFYRKAAISNDGDKKMIVDSIKNNPKITTAEIATIIGKSRRTVQNIISELKAQGIIERIGSNKNGSWVTK